MFQSLSIKQMSSNSWVGTLTVFDRDETFLTGLQRPTSTSYFEIQWGWDRPGAGLKTAPLYIGHVMKIQPRYSFEGTGITYDLNAIALAALDKSIQPRTFKPGMQAEDIVTQICKGHSWKPGIIEATEKPLAEGFQIGNETALQFIQNKIVPLAVTKDKTEHFSFWMEVDGTANFCSTSYYLKTSPDGLKLLDDLVYGEDESGIVESFDPADNGVMGALWGYGDASHYAVDSKEGELVYQTSTVESGVSQTPSQPGPGAPAACADEKDLANLRPVESLGQQGSATPATTVVGYIARTPDDANRLAVNLVSRIKALSCTAEMITHGTHSVAVNRFIRVRYFTHNEQSEHYMSGVFRVLTYEQVLDSGGWKTHYSLNRYGVRPDKAEPQIETQPVTMLTPE